MVPFGPLVSLKYINIVQIVSLSSELSGFFSMKVEPFFYAMGTIVYLTRYECPCELVIAIVLNGQKSRTSENIYLYGQIFIIINSKVNIRLKRIPLQFKHSFGNCQTSKWPPQLNDFSLLNVFFRATDRLFDWSIKSCSVIAPFATYIKIVFGTLSSGFYLPISPF